jgi:sec-independent protein translocase protein TatA
MIAAGLTLPLASFLSPSFGELALIGVIALLLYGSDLPQVIRSWGKTYGEFRKHLNGMRSELNDVIYAEPDSPRKLQYYPEFQHDSSDAEETPEEHDSPVARAAAEAEKAAANHVAAGDEAVRQDTHGAA